MLKVIDRSKDEAIAILAVEGKLAGLEGRSAIQDKVREALKQNKKNIVVDLSRVSWVDSTGLGELIASLSSASKNDGKLVLAQIQAPVQSLLNMTNLTEIFETYETVDEAVKALSEG